MSAVSFGKTGQFENIFCIFLRVIKKRKYEYKK